MRKYFISAVVLFLVLGCNREPDLTGVWIWENEGSTGTYHFMSDSRVTSDLVSGSVTMHSEGQYVIDASKNPMWIDFHWDDGNESKGVFKLDGDSFKACIDALARREKVFDNCPTYKRSNAGD